MNVFFQLTFERCLSVPKEWLRSFPLFIFTVKVTDTKKHETKKNSNVTTARNYMNCPGDKSSRDVCHV
jgi:hypothetical protein